MAELSGNPQISSDVDLNSGPPSPSKSPRKSSPSLLQQAGSRLQQESQSGFGQEGGSSEMMALQGLSMVQKGMQILSAMYPGLTPLVSDVMGRLQMAVPTLVASTQQGGGGLVPMSGMPPQDPSMMGGGPSPMMAPPGGAPPMGPPQGGPMSMPPQMQG